MFFVLRAWVQEWNVGSPGGYELTRKECEVEIMSEDYLITDTALVDSATGTIEVKCVLTAESDNVGQIRKREDLTQWSKDALSKMGI